MKDELVSLLFFPSSSKNLNELVGGGFGIAEFGSILCIYGTGASGKTKTLADLMMRLAKLRTENKLYADIRVKYIDSEDGLTSVRLLKLAEANGYKISVPELKDNNIKERIRKLQQIIILNYKKIGIDIAYVHSHGDLLDEIDKVIKGPENYGLVLIDSLTYQAVGQLLGSDPKKRPQILLDLWGSLISYCLKLHQYAMSKQVAVVVVAQRVSDVADMIDSSGKKLEKSLIKALQGKYKLNFVGGKAIEYSAKTRIFYVNEGPDKTRVILERSDHQGVAGSDPSGFKSCFIKLTDTGIGDIE